MIIKCLSRKTGIKQTINYLFKDKAKCINEKGKILTIKHNIRGRNLESFVKEFQDNEALRLRRRSNSIVAYHTVLSFSSKDKEHITEKMLKDIAKEYIRKRGQDNLYIGTAHFDHDHIHLHLVMSGTKYITGESNRQSKAQFQKLKLSMDNYQKQKYPQLVNSLPKHGRSNPVTQDRNAHIRETQKEALRVIIDSAYRNSKSLNEFLSQIKALGHMPYRRGDKVAGIKFGGIRKYRFQTLGYDKDKISILESKLERENIDLQDLSKIRVRASSLKLEKQTLRNGAFQR